MRTILTLLIASIPVIFSSCGGDDRPHSTGDFVTTWKTNNVSDYSSNETSVTIPTQSTYGPYDYDVDWNNDGVFDELGNSGDVTHNFATQGTYTIRIRGEFPAIYFSTSDDSKPAGDNFKLLSVDQWGKQKWKRLQFMKCANFNVVAQDIPDVSKITDMSYTFGDCTVLNAEMDSWDVSQVTDMQGMFAGATAFNRNLQHWNVSKVTNMVSMFLNAKSFNQDISTWDVSTVRNMNQMFLGAKSFNQDIGNWDVSSVEFMTNMLLVAEDFSTENYDKLLVGWSQRTLRSGVSFSVSTSYCSDMAADGRAKLINDFNWTIEDEGIDPACE